MKILTRDESEECYRAAYRGFGTHWRSGFDVGIDEHGTAYPIASSCVYSGDTTVMRNVSESDFGDWAYPETTEDEFVEGCLDCFGLCEIPEE